MSLQIVKPCADPEVGTEGPDPPLTNHKNHKNRFLSNTGPDGLKNYNAS